MASPNATFTEMVSSTLRNHPSDVADNVSGKNALFNRLKKKGKIRKEDGGYEIVANLDYAENGTYQRYSGYDNLNIQASEVLSSAKYSWVNAAVHVTASGPELLQNAGKSQMISLVKVRTTNAKRTAANNMSVDLYSDGALANQMGGLAHIIQTNGQGTVGGINSTNYTFWRNQFREIAGTNTVSKSTIKGEMNALWLDCCRENEHPDLVVSSQDFFSMYWESLQDLQRYATADEAEAGFQKLKYVSADVIYDSNSNFSSTAEKMFFLNTEYLEMVVHKDANWTQLDEKTSVNQHAVVIPIIWMGNLVCSNRARQGVLLDAA